MGFSDFTNEANLDQTLDKQVVGMHKPLKEMLFEQIQNIEKALDDVRIDPRLEIPLGSITEHVISLEQVKNNYLRKYQEKVSQYFTFYLRLFLTLYAKYK